MRAFDEMFGDHLECVRIPALRDLSGAYLPSALVAANMMVFSDLCKHSLPTVVRVARVALIDFTRDHQLVTRAMRIAKRIERSASPESKRCGDSAIDRVFLRNRPPAQFGDPGGRLQEVLAGPLGQREVMGEAFANRIPSVNGIVGFLVAPLVKGEPFSGDGKPPRTCKPP